jgi:hypothetical protein
MSYPGYIEKGKQHEWVEYSWVLSKFGNKRSMARKGYRKYMDEALNVKPENPIRNLHSQVILGGKEFIDKIKGMLKGKSLSHEIIERTRLVEKPFPNEVISTVARAFDIKEDTIEDKGNRNNTARKVAIYLVQRYTGLSNEDIGKLFGGIHYSAISKASARLKQDISTDKKLLKLVEKLDSHFKT